MIYLEIAVIAPIYKLLTYSYDHEADKYSESQYVGRRVLVYLNGRKTTGYVLDTGKEQKLGYNVLPVIEFLDDLPLFPRNMASFFQWMAGYYCTPIGKVVQAALPSGVTAKEEEILYIVEGKNEKLAKEKKLLQKPLFQELLKNGKLSASKTKRILQNKTDRKTADQLIGQGLLHKRKELRKENISAKKEVCYVLEEGTKNMFQHLKIPQKRGDEHYIAWQKIAKTDFSLPEMKTIARIIKQEKEGNERSVARKELVSGYSGAVGAIQKLIEKKLVRKIEKRILRNPAGAPVVQEKKNFKLTEEQSSVINHIYSSIEKEVFDTVLLHGVTGGGKTEVYLKSAEKVLEHGKDVLVLVPEIALASHLETHFFGRFGDRIIIMHSGLTQGERYDQWFRAGFEKPKIIIGARSAVFAPLPQLGLIIVDEEHDSSFKQENGFRYNGRDLAVKRGQLNNAVVILGSATPSVTSYFNAINGKYSLQKIEKRVSDRKLPEVKLVDIKQPDSVTKGSVFKKDLLESIKNNLNNSRQTILLHNRRGFSSVVMCRNCGNHLQCKRCNVSLTYHKKEGRLRCHYCDFSLKADTVCDVCRSDKMIPVGFGTERLEEELKDMFPDARIERLDSDTAADRKKFFSLLADMREKKIDILIGTQMIAKGHDFPEVTLVGVVFADSGLHLPHYKAGENTFQILSQVIGRAGRGDWPGKVIIQTAQPEHYAIQYAMKHDYAGFYKKEVELRKFPQYPPFNRLIAVHFKGKMKQKVKTCAIQFMKAIMETIDDEKIRTFNVQMLGPAPSPIERINEKFRFQLLMKTATFTLQREVAEMLQNIKIEMQNSNVSIELDIDPESLM